MSKRIVILCDGTWNEAESKTHIHWLKQNLVNKKGVQEVHYQEGVGSAWYNRLSGGAMGAGLSRDIRQCYERLWEMYEPNDEVFIFGFSRGSFTARSLAGFISMVGRLERKDDVGKAFAYYRFSEPGEDPNWFESLFKPRTAGALPIRFLGVFDTVGSLGIPFEIKDEPKDWVEEGLIDSIRHKARSVLDNAGDKLRRPIVGFHDTELGPGVQEAYHALAIDERRELFSPVLWTRAAGKAFRLDDQGAPTIKVDQRVEQAWFAGVHGDVGGGYFEPPKDGDNESQPEKLETSLSAIPLDWMIRRATRAGITFNNDMPAKLTSWAAGLTRSPQNDSFTKVWVPAHKLANKWYIDRPIGNTQRQALDPVGDIWPKLSPNTSTFHEYIHVSVAKRLNHEVEIKTKNPELRSRFIYGDHRSLPSELIFQEPNEQ